MNKIINKFLLTCDRFMPELHLKQRRFTKRASGSFTKHRDHLLKIKKFREGYLLILLSAYSDGKNEAKRTVSDKIF